MKFVFALALVALYVALMGARPNVEVNHRAVRGAGGAGGETSNGVRNDKKQQHQGGRKVPAAVDKALEASEEAEDVEEEGEAAENVEGNPEKKSVNRARRRDEDKNEEEREKNDERGEEALEAGEREEDIDDNGANRKKNDHERSRRAAFKSDFGPDFGMWDLGNIPYAFDGTTLKGDETTRKGSTLKELVKKAVDEWNTKTGLNIHEVTVGECKTLNEPLPETPDEPRSDCITIKSDKGCWSWIGKQNGKLHDNEISLQKDACFTYGVILHEFGHALGLEHEAKRTDRDQYVKVEFTNVKEKFEPQFTQLKKDGYKSIFDPCSIMMYQNDAFSENGDETILLKNNKNDIQCMGNHKSISLLDGIIVAEEYGFLDKVKSKKCDNGGYRLTKGGGRSEKCICSNIYEGDKCDKAFEGRECGKTAFKLGEGEAARFQSPKYPQPYAEDNHCIWTFVQNRVDTDKKKKLCLYFPDGYNIEEPATTSSGKDICYYSIMNAFDGPFRTLDSKGYCGAKPGELSMVFDLADEAYDGSKLGYYWGAVSFATDPESWPPTDNPSGFKGVAMFVDSENECNKDVEGIAKNSPVNSDTYKNTEKEYKDNQNYGYNYDDYYGHYMGNDQFYYYYYDEN